MRYQHIARVTIELLSPLSIGSGEVDSRYDVMLVRDANGLPAIPGTSIAGVLRSAFQKVSGQAAVASKLFGKTVGELRAADALRLKKKAPKEFDASRVSVSWAAVHSSTNKPVTGLLLDGTAEQDDLLRTLLADQPQRRDHVRLSHRGGAAHQGKFDRGSIPPGHRFTFEISLQSEDATTADEDWARLLSVLKSPQFRLGGGTRRGLGQLKVQALWAASFDLAKGHDLENFSLLSRELSEQLPRSFEDKLNCISAAFIGNDASFVVKLVPKDYWRFGQGTDPLRGGTDRNAQLLQMTEMHVGWKGNVGRLEHRRIVVPASGIKGALAHRVAFHDRKRNNLWADDMTVWAAPASEGMNGAPTTIESAAVVELFGTKKETARDVGRVGKVIIDDVYLPIPGAEQIGVTTHNGVDRFSGGVRGGVLFAEESLFEVPWEIRIRIVDATSLSPRAKRAFADTLNDLTSGRLALGAGASRGQGYFSGDSLEICRALGEVA